MLEAAFIETRHSRPVNPTSSGATLISHDHGCLAAPPPVLPRSWPTHAIYQRERGVGDLARHPLGQNGHDHDLDASDLKQFA